MARVAVYFRYVDRHGADVTGLGETDGYCLQDFFGLRLEEIYAQHSVAIALRLLKASYQGADPAGVGVRWRIEPGEQGRRFQC